MARSLFSLFYLFSFTSGLLFSCVAAAGEEASLAFRLYKLETPVNSADDISQNFSGLNWKAAKKSTVYLASKENSSWLRLDLDNPGQQALQRYMELDATDIRSADFFIWNPEQKQLTPLYAELGYNHRFNNRPVNYKNLVLPLTLQANSQQQLLIHIRHNYGLKLRLKFWEESAFKQNSTRELVFFGMIYGALSMIVIYNLFIYLSLREKNHLLFVLYGTFTGLFISMQEGHFVQFIFPNMEWPKDIFFALVTALMSFSFTFFCIYFLDLERWSNWLFRILLFLGSTTALILVIFGINDQAMMLSHYTLLLVILLYSTAIWAGIFVWHKGISSAGFFSLAIFLCTLGLLVEFFSHFPLLNLEHPAYSYASLGNTAMIFVFAFALADKMRVLQNEKLKASMELVKLTEEKAQNNLESFRMKLHEVELEKEATQAQIESRAKSEFLATMSHEIRTPMNGVLGITELLSDTSLDDQQRSYVSSIYSSAKTLLSVINDLLDYSRIESGQMELQARVFNLENVIDDCINIFALKAADAKIHFLGQIEPGTPLQYKGDAEKLRQITLNLLGIAFGYNKSGDIFLQVHPTGKASINSAELRFEIHSRGTHLDDEERQNLLSPFHENRSKKKMHSSLELGLTVSRQLVELMQGDLGLESSDDGTTLWFTVRLIFPHNNENQLEEDRSRSLNNRRLLICDQNPDFIRSVTDYAASWGMEVDAITDGNDVADKLLSTKTAYQVLMISEEDLTPAIQLAIRQSNVEHNFITSIILTTRTSTMLSREDMARRGIQCMLEVPYTASQLYHTLLRSMGLDTRETDIESEEEKLSLLIAEDNDVNMMVIDGLLKKLGFEPATAENGKQAFNAYQEHNQEFDIIFMDCEMPEVDGYDAARLIRQYENSHGIEKPVVIIALSAHSAPEYREQAITAGMNDFLVKPVSRDDIETIIHRYKNGFFHTTEDDDEENA